MKFFLAALGAILVLSVPGPIQTPAPQQDVDALVAPIALYPDALLGPMLLSAANPATIGALNEWLRSHDTVKGTALQDAAKASGFAESYVALVLFPQVVQKMAEQIDWTTKLGRAFTADRAGVFASIQRLRTTAKNAGKLASNAQQSVTTEQSAGGQQVIVIEPANPQIVYVPQYNPQTVYAPSTVVIQEEDDSDAAVAAGLIGFTAGIALGAAMDNDYYYGPYGWGGGFRMYDDAWDDWYDHREDSREDWQDYREDVVEDRGDRARTSQEQRTERSETRQAAGTERTEARQAAGTERTNARQGAGTERTDARQAAGTERTSAAARGDSQAAPRTAAERTGTRSDAFSGYSSGKSERAASSRGASSRSSSRSGGGGGRRR
jgi:Protein of unknown function (DUF3300)